MTKMLIRYPVDGNTSIVAEVDLPESEVRRSIPAGRVQDTVVSATQSFQEAMNTIEPIAKTIYGRLATLKADETEVTFGIKLTAEAGAILASAGIEANYTVKLKWTNKPE